MTDSEITLSVLREIRDGIRTLDANLSTRIDSTNERIDSTNQRIDARFGVIETALSDLGAQMILMTRYLKNRTEVEVQDLKLRVAKLESKVG